MGKSVNTQKLRSYNKLFFFFQFLLQLGSPNNVYFNIGSSRLQ